MAEAQASGGSGVGTTFRIERPIETEIERESGEDSGETIDFTASRVAGKVASAGAQAGVDDATIGVEQPLPRQRRCSLCSELGHTARTCPNANSDSVATRPRKAPSAAASASLGPMLVGTVNFCVAQSFGADCALTSLEGQILIPSVQRTLERLPKEAAERAAWIIDPLVILTVCVMWSKRIYTIKRAEALQQYVVAPHEAQRAAGISGTEYSNGVAPQAPEPQNPNGVAAAPDPIRRGFDDAI